MGRPRTELQTLLEAVLGSEAVYFQSPPNVQMQYPCVVYSHDNADTKFAGNVPYLVTPRYQVMYISKTPDDAVLDDIAALPMCIFNRFYIAKNLNHDVYNLYF